MYVSCSVSDLGLAPLAAPLLEMCYSFGPKELAGTVWQQSERSELNITVLHSSQLGPTVLKLEVRPLAGVAW